MMCRKPFFATFFRRKLSRKIGTNLLYDLLVEGARITYKKNSGAFFSAGLQVSLMLLQALKSTLLHPFARSQSRRIGIVIGSPPLLSLPSRTFGTKKRPGTRSDASERVGGLKRTEQHTLAPALWPGVEHGVHHYRMAIGEKGGDFPPLRFASWQNNRDGKDKIVIL